MKKFLFIVISILALQTVLIAQPGTTRFPPYLGRRSSAPANCTADSGQWYYNTTSDKFQYCSATNTWTDMSGGGGGLSTGSAVTGGGANRVLYEDGSQNLAASANLTYGASASTLLITSGAAADNPLIVRGAGSQSGDLTVWQNSTPTKLLAITSAGAIETTANNLDLKSNNFDILLNPNNGHIKTASNNIIKWSDTSGNPSASIDLGIGRGAAKVLKLTDGASAGGTISSPPLSPTALSGNTDNYNPGTTRHLRISASTPVNLTGIVAGQDGQELFIWNVGATNTITITHQTVSTAANQFFTTTAANLALAAGKCAIAMYDGTTARWRVSLLP